MRRKEFAAALDDRMARDFVASHRIAFDPNGNELRLLHSHGEIRIYESGDQRFLVEFYGDRWTIYAHHESGSGK